MKTKEQEILTDVHVIKGLFGYKIVERLPKNVWELLKSDVEYHDGGIDDQEWAEDVDCFDVSPDDLEGWFCGDEAIQSLLDAGITVIFGEERITSVENIHAIIRRDSGEDEELDEQAKAFNKTLLHLEKEYMNEVDVKELYAKNLPQILIPELNIKGHDVYGGGSFLLLDENYLYIIQNNGRDGDSWMHNNYPTDGAGAIANRIKRSDARAWMDEVEVYFRTSYFTRSEGEVNAIYEKMFGSGLNLPFEEWILQNKK